MREVAADGGPIVLVEYERLRVTGLRPVPADRDAVASDDLCRRLTMRWLKDDTLEIEAGSHIGVIDLACVTIHVRPKLAGQELAVLQMLDYVGGLDALRDIGLLQRIGHGLHLFDLICRLLTHECARLLHEGLRRDYVRFEEAIPVLRGRLLANRQILHRHGRLDRLECRFDELSGDILENRLCGAALHLAAHTATDTRVRADARRLAADFASACSIDGFNARQVEERLIYHRSNEHYRTAHRWALMVLNGIAFADLYMSRGQRLNAFMIDMNSVFEAFVTRLLRDAFHDSEINVYAQNPLREAIRHHGGPPYTTITPDIQLIHGGRRYSIDAKYKLYREATIQPGDLYQSFAYGLALSAAADQAPPTAYILYASDQDVKPETVTLYRYDQTPTVSVTAIGINVPKILKALTEQRHKGCLDGLRNTLLGTPGLTPLRRRGGAGDA